MPLKVKLFMEQMLFNKEDMFKEVILKVIKFKVHLILLDNKDNTLLTVMQIIQLEMLAETINMLVMYMQMIIMLLEDILLITMPLTATLTKML